MQINLKKMITESRNPASADIDTLSTLDVLTVINQEDKKVPLAVEAAIPEITQVVDAVVVAFFQRRTFDLQRRGYLWPLRDPRCQ